MTPLGLGTGYRLATDGELAQLWGLAFRAALGRVLALPGDGSAQVLLGDGVGDPVVCWPVAHLRVSVGADVWVAWFGGVPVIVGGLNGCTVDAGILGGILPVGKGGTGATTVDAARVNLGSVGKYAMDIGDGSATQFAVTHNLGTLDVLVQVRCTAAPCAVVWPDVQMIDGNSVRVLFAAAPAMGAYRVVVIG